MQQAWAAYWLASEPLTGCGLRNPTPSWSFGTLLDRGGTTPEGRTSGRTRATRDPATGDQGARQGQLAQRILPRSGPSFDRPAGHRAAGRAGAHHRRDARARDREHAAAGKTESGLIGPIRGTRLPAEIKHRVLEAIHDAKRRGFTLERACATIGLDPRRARRCQTQGGIAGLLVERVGVGAPGTPESLADRLQASARPHDQGAGRGPGRRGGGLTRAPAPPQAHPPPVAAGPRVLLGVEHAWNLAGSGEDLKPTSGAGARCARARSWTPPSPTVPGATTPRACRPTRGTTTSSR